MTVELEAAQKTICRRAAKLANRRLREELLSETSEYSLLRRLAVLKGTTVAVLRTSWNPLKPDTNGKSGFGYSLKVEDDALTIALMQDVGVYDRVVEIGIAAMAETMTNNSQTFVSAVLNDLFSEEPFYEVA